MENLLEVAQTKYVKTKEGVTNFSKDFKTFLLECYIHLTPASYGYQIQNRVLKSLKKIEVKSSKKNCADFSIGNWKLLLCNQYLAQVMKFYEHNKYFMDDRTISPFRNVLLDILNKLHDKYFLNGEVKVSYLNKKGIYTLRNLRPYQNYSHYLIVFIDCEDSFNYKMSLVSKDIISDTLHLSDMHGVKDVNIDVTNKHLGGVVKKNSYEEYIIFNKYNLLKSNDFESIDDAIDLLLKPFEDEISKLTLEDISEICPNFNEIFDRVTRR
jgi:hypothetical protein